MKYKLIERENIKWVLDESPIVVSLVHRFAPIETKRIHSLGMLDLARRTKSKESFDQDENQTLIFRRPVDCSTDQTSHYILSVILRVNLTVKK